MKYLLSTLALMASLTSNAAVINLGTLAPQKTENVFSLFNTASLADSYSFTVTSSFAFTSSVNAYDITNFGISLTGPGGYLFGQDSLTSITPLSGFSTGLNAEITEKTLGAGTYSFSVIGNSTDLSSAYVGSFTVGRPAPVAAVPEPETYAMILAGLGLLGFASRKRKV